MEKVYFNQENLKFYINLQFIPLHYLTVLLNRLKPGIIPSSSVDKENKKFKRFSDNKGRKTNKKLRFSDSMNYRSTLTH